MVFNAKEPQMQMKRFLLVGSLLFLVPPVWAEVNEIPDQVRDACLPAADFAGCVKAFTEKKKEVIEDDCELKGGRKWCWVKADGYDYLGTPKITNWLYIEYRDMNAIVYERVKSQKVNVRGSTDRYLEDKKIVRKYYPAQAGSPATSTTIGSAQTNCNSFGGSINCTTTPATTLTSPGRAALPAGVRQFTYSTIVDCKDKTFALYITYPGKSTPEQSGKWRQIRPGSKEEGVLKSCSKINELPLSSFNKLSGR